MNRVLGEYFKILLFGKYFGGFLSVAKYSGGGLSVITQLGRSLSVGLTSPVMLAVVNQHIIKGYFMNRPIWVSLHFQDKK